MKSLKEVEREIAMEAVRKLDEETRNPNTTRTPLTIDELKERLTRTANITPSSALSIGRIFMRETDPNKN